MKNARLDNFKFWYKDVMIRLFADRDAGFVILKRHKRKDIKGSDLQEKT